MSFDPQGGWRKDVDNKTVPFVNDKSLMSEKTHLPDLDYKKLAIARLSGLSPKKADKTPTGRYDALVKYLQQRGSAVDAAEVDRRTRTWFEDIINRLLTNPAEWDADRVLDGKALMDYLSGIKGQDKPQAAPPAQPGGPA
jgi:hypothetical protein